MFIYLDDVYLCCLEYCFSMVINLLFFSLYFNKFDFVYVVI